MSNTTLIVAAIVAILAIVGLFLLLRKPTQRVSLSDSVAPPPAPKPAPVPTPAPVPARAPATREGHGIADSAAAAVLDISGPVIGVDAHPDLPSDDLSQIKGLGPKAKAVLAGFGIHRFAQLAALDPAQAADLDARLGAFKGRLFRDRWIDQARYLEQDDIAGFEKEFGKLGMTLATGTDARVGALLASTVVPRWDPEILVSDSVKPSPQLDMWTYRPQSKFTAPEIYFSAAQPLMTIGGSFLTLAEQTGLVPGSAYLNDGRWREALAAAGTFRTIEEPVLVAGNAVTRNHYHWLLQCLAPILIAEHLGVAPGCHMLVPTLNPVGRDSMAASGIASDRVIELAVGEVALPALGIHTNLTTGDFAFTPHPTLVAAFDHLVVPPEPSRFAGQRVYIARFDAWKRRMSNEEELRDRLEALGFVTLLATELSFAEQCALFRDAAVIVTQHGAALTNILFTPATGPRIIELHQENYLHMAFLKLGQVKRLRYTAIINPMDMAGPDPHRSTWRADVPLIERAVES